MRRRGRPSGASPTGAERRRVMSAVFRGVFGPALDFVYHYLDLTGRDGRPDHGKIFGSIAFGFGLIGLALFGPAVIRTCEAVTAAAIRDPETAAVLVKACGLMLTALLAYGGLVFAMAFGLAGFRVWAKSRAAGTSAALGQASSFEALATQALREVSPEGREHADEL